MCGEERGIARDGTSFSTRGAAVSIPAGRRDQAFPMDSGGWSEQLKNIESDVKGCQAQRAGGAGSPIAVAFLGNFVQSPRL